MVDAIDAAFAAEVAAASAAPGAGAAAQGGEEAAAGAAAAAAQEAALGAARRARASSLEALAADASRPFTGGLPLGEWLEYLPWADPVTGAPLPRPSGGGGGGGSGDGTRDGSGSGVGAGAAGVWWEGEVTAATLGFFLRAVADLWLGAGVARQVRTLAPLPTSRAAPLVRCTPRALPPDPPLPDSRPAQGPRTRPILDP